MMIPKHDILKGIFQRSSSITFRYCLSCILLLGILFSGNRIKAQVATYYTFSQSDQTYKSDTSTTTTIPASIFSTSWDDATHTGFTFPFNFTYNGILYTAGVGTIGIDSDGWIAFSTGAITMTGTGSGGSWISISDHTGMYLNGTANNNGFCGFNSDLEEQTWATFTGNTTSGSTTVTGVSDFSNLRVGSRLSGTGITDGTVINRINVATSTFYMSATATVTATAATLTPRASIYAFTRGIAPYRQFVVQWTRAIRYSGVGTGDDFSFQMVLNEGGANASYQTLQAVYGICKATTVTPQNAQVGLRGASAADFNARTTTTNWSATTAAAVNTATCSLTNAVFPISGITFTWSPACPGNPSNAGAISGPVNVCPGTSVNYSIPGVPGAIFYTWTYTGTNTSFSGTTTLPVNTLDFGLTATGGTLTVTPGNLCGSGTASSIVISMSALPSATITYTPASFCTSASPVTPVITGTMGGTFSASPTGLTINPSTGQVTPATSTAGNYVVTYTFTSGCTATATANVSINAGPALTVTATPASVCAAPNSSQLLASVPVSSYSLASIAYTSLTPSAGSTIVWNTYQLDNISGAIAMPFTFNYYGLPIANFYVSTEGYVQLQTGTAVAWTPQTLPNATAPNNIIALSWADLIVDPSTNPGSSVRYFVNGTTPNRILVIDYINLRFLVGTGAQNVTGQIRMYESDSHIEIAAGTVNDDGDAWSKTMGIENSTGTVATTPAGRNNLVWNTGSEAWSFTPASNSYTYSWSPATYLSSTSIANPVATNLAATTPYTVVVTNTATGCTGSAGATVTVGAGLNGTYTVGAAGNYPTLTAAVNAYNSLCLTGPVVFSLIDATYNASETFPISINNNAYASATNTLTIQPASAVNATISGSLASNALIRITGKYISINGSNNNTTTRNLSITNTSTTSPSVVLFGSVGVTPVTNVSLKNSTITNGINSSSAVVVSAAASLGTAGYFSNDTIQNNIIQKAYIGIYSIAVNSAGNGSGLNILSNDLTASGANAIYIAGIYAQDIDGATIKDNQVANLVGTDSYDDKGIWLATGVRNSSVLSNKITNLNYTGGLGYGPYGICISTGVTNANNLVANNMIANITGDGYDYTSASFALDNPTGILLFSTQTGINIYNNSINLYGSTINSANAVSSCIRLYTGSVADIRNNILVNKLGRSGANGFAAVGILTSTSNAQFTALDYNDYLINPASMPNKFFGQIAGTGQTTLAGWKTASGNREVFAQNIDPVFTAATDLHLPGASNIGFNNLGTSITGLTVDYDNTTRNGLTPDIGADEFLSPNTGSWVGKTNIDWLVATNWEANYVPDNTTDVFITGGYTFMPTIVTTQAVRNLALSAPGTPPLLTLNAGILQVYGAITRTGGTIDGSNGTLEMKGTVAQSIPVSLFQSNNLKNLIISNTDNVTGVTLGGVLDIYRSVTFGAGGRKLTTSNALTFKSTATETAWLGQMLGTNSIVGTATVERYIPLHTKAWQFLSTPITAASTQTVKQAWQEGAAVANANPVPGYGTQLTSNIIGAASQPTPGFDAYTYPGPSIKTYKTGGGYTGLNRTDTIISNPKGYMVFIRGNRSVITSGGAATTTVMRMKGTLHTPANPPVTINVASPGFASVGNPYASAINFRNLTFTGGVQTDFFYLWDPKLTTLGVNSTWGFGGFQTFSWSGSAFNVTPGGGSYTGANRFIESGQAFFINAPLSAGTLAFPETGKVSGSFVVNRPPAVSAKQLRTNLYVITGADKILLDGNLVEFDRTYSNAVDIKDGIKMNNSGENLGLSRNSKLLAVERRSLIRRTDTIFYDLGQLKIQPYEFEFMATGLEEPGLAAWLEDNYLHTSSSVSLDDITRISFNVDADTRSYATDRFRLVFRQQRHNNPLPLATSELNAGNQKQDSPEAKPSISINPNPVTDKTIQLQFRNQLPGNYNIRVMNKLGQQVYNSNIQVSSSDMNKAIPLPGIVSGNYLLRITDESGKAATLNVIVL